MFHLANRFSPVACDLSELAHIYIYIYIYTQLRRGALTVTHFTPKSAKTQNSREFPNFILQNIEKQTVLCKRTAEEVSFEWSHHRISSTDSKVRTTLHVSITDSGS